MKLNKEPHIGASHWLATPVLLYFNVSAKWKWTCTVFECVL